MLIITSKSPGWGKQKPKQWGSLSAVRSAVFRNAEAMGMPAPVSLWPLWEGAGSNAHDILISNHGSIVNGGDLGLAWVNDGLKNVRADGIAYVDVGDYPQLEKMSVFVTTKRWQAVSWERLLQRANDDAYGFSLRTYSGTFIFQHRGTDTSLNAMSPVTDVGKIYSVAGSTDGTTLNIYLDGSVGSGTVVDSGGDGGGTNLNLFRRANQASSDYSGSLGVVAIWSEALAAETFALLDGVPYALLQPNQAPLIFDWGSSNIDLVVADTLHSHSANNLVITQNHNITAADALHNHTADNLALLQQHVLSLSDGLHGHTADNLAIIQQQLLSIFAAAHSHTADNLDITQNHNISAADALHNHTADGLTLSQIHNLTVADSLHGHTADNITLLLGELVLAIAAATHSHTADNLTLLQQHQLIIAEALHAHTADNLTLDLSLVLAIADALHNHSADSLTLTQQHILSADDALHQLLSDSPDLLQQHTISINDTLHSHTADNITLYVNGLGLGIITDTTAIHLTPQRGKLILTVERSAKHV